MGERVSGVLFLLVLWSADTSLVAGLKECKKHSTCSCSTDRGVIDLAKTKASFSGIKDANSPALYGYLWSPCKPLGENAHNCRDAAVCLQSLTGAYTFTPIGDPHSAECKLGTSGQCVLAYTGTSYDVKSNVEISLECKEGEEGAVDPVKSDPSQVFFSTTFHSRYACLVTNSPSQISTGSILLIIFFPLVLAYIIGGILFNKYHRGATGREVFPNHSFWADFPILVKDGLVFTYRQCRQLCGAKDTYGAI